MSGKAFSLAAVGDLVPSRRLPRGGDGSDGYGQALEWLNRADITFGDLEIPLASVGNPREKLIAFRASPEIVQDLPALGFDVLSLANNHSFDYGPEALNETMAGLDRLQLRHFGAGPDIDSAMRPVVLEVGGLKVGFIGWSCLLPTGAAASDSRPGLSPLHVHTSYEVDAFTQMEEPGNPPVVRTWVDAGDLERAQRQVRLLRAEVDFLAVSVHWGYGAGDFLAEYQRPLGHAFVDAGADIVLGNHVHAVHGVEVYEGKCILYSPGNFIAQQPREGLSAAALAVLDEMSADGYLAYVEVSEDGGYEVEFVPTSTGSDGLPEVLEGADRGRIIDRLERLSGELGTSLDRQGERVLVRCASGPARDAASSAAGSAVFSGAS